MGRSEGGLAVVTMQQNHHTSSSGSVSGPGNVDSKNNKQNSCARVGADEEPNDNFPVGMRVLVVDDDPICLLLLESLLRRCQYKVTTCGQARTALNLLREKKDSFDLVISDVYMPDMDGFKLLELVGLEMDLPVIMMSANGETSVVMKGITHGACDYLIKPVRLEELKNIWQHVIRKKRTEANNKDIHVSSSQGEGAGRNTRAADDVENGSGLNEGTERSGSKTSRKRKDQEDDEEEDENDHESEDPSTLKKPRVVWSVDLHQQFVSAVNTLGIDKAVPKRILELMNVQGLTRENVASHLQKYRLYLKRLSGVASQQGGMANAFCGRESSFGALAPVEGFSDLQVLAQSGQLSAHPLASLQAGALGRLNGSVGIGMPGMNSSGVIQYSNIPNFSTNPPVVRSPRSAVAINNPSNMLSCLAPGSELSQLQHKQMSRPGDMSSSVEDPTRFLSMQQQLSPTSNIPLAMARGGNGNVPVNPANNALLMQLMQQQSRGLGNLSAERSLNQRANPSDGNLVVSSSLSTNGLNANWVSSPSMSGVTANSQPGNCLPTNASNVECKPTEVPAASSNSGMAPGSHNLGPRRDIGHPSMASIGDLCDLVSLDGRRVNIPPFSHGSANTRHDMGHGLKQDWQNQNPDFRSINNSMLNNQLSQATGLVNQRAVEPYIAHSQGQSPGFCNSNLNVDVKPSVNPMAPVFGGQCDNEQSTADSGLKIKEEYSMNLFKAGGVLFSEECNTDELMSILYKQQQEGIGYSDCDSALDAFPLKTCI